MSSFYGTIGKQGEPGPKGDTGLGINEISNIEEIDSAGIYRQGNQAYIAASKDDVNKIINSEDNASNSFINNKNGEEIIIISDISPIEHKLKIKIDNGKNIVNLNNFKLGWSINESGVGSKIYVEEEVAAASNMYIKVEPNIDYTFSLDNTSLWLDRIVEMNEIDLCIINHAFYAQAQDLKTFSWKTNKNTEYIGVRLTKKDNNAITFEDIENANLQIEKGTVATEFTPHIDMNNITVSRYGKNLLPYPYEISPSAEMAGVKYIDNRDGTISIISETIQNASSGFTLNKITDLKPNTQYCYSGFGDVTNANADVVLFDGNGNKIAQITVSSDSQSSINFNTADYPTVKYCTVTIRKSSHGKAIFGVMKPQFEIGSIATEYEPYKKPIACTPAVDGTCEIISAFPTTVLLTNTEGVTIECEYNQNINKSIGDMHANLQELTSDIQELQEQVNEHKDIANNIFANALKDNKSGEIITISDISPIEHELNVNVRSKNIIPYPYFNTNKEHNGITYTDNGDGSVTVNGTATFFSAFYLTNELYEVNNINDLFENGKTYCINNSSSNNVSFVLVYSRITDGQTFYVYAGKPFTVDKSHYIYLQFRIQVSENITVNNETVYPQIELGTMPTTYTPYVDVSTVKVNRYSKNLLQYPYTNGALATESYGITFTYNDDGTIGIRGKANQYSSTQLIGKNSNSNALSPYLKDGETYTLSIHSLSGATTIPRVLIEYTNIVTGTKGYVNYNNPTFTVDKSKYTYEYLRVFIDNSMTNIEFDCVIGVQLEMGAEITAFETYKEITANVEVDGTVKGVTSLYPTTTLTTDTTGAIINVEYNRDLNKAFAELQQAIISLGGNV